MIEKFKTLINNIQLIKADRCFIPQSEINLYNAVSNTQNLANAIITFDGTTLPVDSADLRIVDPVNNISILADYNSGDPFIKLIGLTEGDVDVYADGTWNSELEFTLPFNFNYTIIDGINQQLVLSKSIILTVPKHEQTICGLASHIYGGSGESQGFSNLWVDDANGDDDNDGFTRSSAFKTVDKALDLLNNTSTGDHIITVNIASGTYNYTTNTVNTMSKVYFTGDVNYPGDEIIIRVTEPIIFKSSNYLSFKEIRITNTTNNINHEGLDLVFYDCENFEIFQCNLLHTGDSTTLDNVGLLSLINSNGIVQNTELSYLNLQTGAPDGAGGVRVTNNAYFSINNWNVTSNNLQWLCLNKEGWFFAHEDVPTNNNAVPYSCENTIGYYKCITKCPSNGSGEVTNFYDAIHTPNFNFNSAQLDFSDITFPTSATENTECKDLIHDTGIYATYNAYWWSPVTEYVNLYRLGTDYPIYKQATWASNPVQTLPEGTDFSEASLTNFEEQQAFWSSIKVTPSSSLTVCEKFAEVDDKLDKSVYSEDGTVKDITFGEEPSIAESIAHPNRLYLWSE
jgi:hypothetical protein